MSTARQSQTDNGAKFTVLYDGQCRICSASTRWIKRLDTRGQFVCRTQHFDEPCAGPVCRRELQLSCPDGTTLTGWSAVATIARRLPLVSWFGLLASLKPFHWLGTRFYGWVARNRYRFGKIWSDRDDRP